ncbi:MAG TPA: MlaD family protein [Candidatus Saccharimonadales bacterium]|nr:MlaD family protein [Candidatus Saccharimonadales bacterium]
MNDSRFAGKVGFFVALGIVVLGLLFMSFSKGLSLFVKTYEIKLRAASVGGLKKNAAVLLSGVTIGNVIDTEIPAEGKGVFLRLKIQEKYKIHSDARFAIEQIGFLGDQFVAIYPQDNTGPILAPGAVVKAEEPLNIGEVVRSASGLIQGVNQTIKTLNEAVSRVERTVLSDVTLSNVTETLANFRQLSTKALGMVDGIDRLVSTNTPGIYVAVSNLVLFSQDLDKLADELGTTLKLNGVELTKAVKNLEKTSIVLERLANEVDSGKGLAGSLVKDQAMSKHLSMTVSNMSVLTSNLTRFGLLYKPKQPKPESANRKPIYPGKNPIE